jgi:hypothetical protein
MMPRLLEGIRTINDRTLAREVVAFLEAHPLAQDELKVRQHCERMWVSVALAQRVPSELVAALA